MIAFKQHAYIKGRSVETALQEVVGTIETTLVKKELCLSVFIDIEGAFNNVTTSAILAALASAGVENYVVAWISHLLRNRSITCEQMGVTLKRFVQRGTPQGGILSPLLWVLIVNGLLKRLTEEGIRVVGYADD